MWPLLLATAVIAGNADEPAPDQSDVVVKGARAAGRADTSPYPPIVIDEVALAARTSVADALTDLPEVYVQVPGGRSGTAALFVRGGDPNFTTVLLDGLPLNNPANVLGGSVNVSEYGAAAFERVELVAGPFSSLYGSGALAGVVNLVVPAGTPGTRTDVQGAIGTSLERSLFARVRGPLGAAAGGSLAASLDDTGESEGLSRFRSLALIGKVAGGDQDDRLVFRAARTNSRGFPDASGGVRLAVLRTLEVRKSDELVAGATKRLARFGATRIELAASLLARRDRTDTPGVASSPGDPFGVPGGLDTTRYRRLTGQVIARYGASGVLGIAGVEAQHELARSEGELRLFGMVVPSGFRGDRKSAAAFLEASRTTATWVVNGGGRVDRIEGLGTHATGRLGVRHTPGSPGLALHASAANGFKAPSFYALGNPFVGNATLRPERSFAVEAGIAWDADRSNLSLTAFRTRYTDLIDFVADPIPRLENRAQVVTQGISLAVRHRPDDRVSFALQGQILEATDRTNGERLLNRPRWRASATITWAASPAFKITARGNGAGERLAYSVPTGTLDLRAYGYVSVDAAWTMRRGPVLRLVIDNALDGENEDAVGFTAPGRRARLIVSHAFGSSITSVR